MVDGELTAATTFSGALEELLQQLKNGYVTANTVDCYFKEQIEIRHEYVKKEYMMNLGYIAELLNDTKQGEEIYTVQAGDVWGQIANDHGMLINELLALNPGYDVDKIHVGDQLTISNAVPYLTVVDVERQSGVQDIPYEVEYQDDSSLYVGDTRVLSAGVYGKADVTANVTYINGEETNREVVASVTLSEPVAELQARGTMERRRGCRPRIVPLAVQRAHQLPLRLPQHRHRRSLDVSQGHRHRQLLRHAHPRRRRRHGDVCRLDERIRLSDHHRPRQRL